MAGNQPKKEKPPAEIVSKAARISSNKMANNSQNQRVQAGINFEQIILKFAPFQTKRKQIKRINTPEHSSGQVGKDEVSSSNLDSSL